MKQPKPRRMKPNEDVMSSIETLNCSTSNPYPALASGERAPSRLAANVLQ